MDTNDNHRDQIANLSRTYGVRPDPNHKGFVAFRGAAVIGKAKTEHEARILASNHCFDEAVARGKTYITISPTSPIGDVPITMARDYRATLLTKKAGWKEARRVRINAQGEPEVLLGGEYYVCHGLKPLTFQEAYMSSYPTFEVGDRKGLHLVTEMEPAQGEDKHRAWLKVECACGKQTHVRAYDFGPHYRCDKTCPAHKAMRDRGSRIDKFGEVMDKDDWPEDPTLAKTAPTQAEEILAGMPHKDAPYAEWVAYHAKVEKKKAAEEAKAARAKAKKDAEWGEPGLDDDNL